MEKLDFGKLTTIILGFFIVSFFFGEKIFFWYEHKDDLKLELSKMAYTKEDFYKMSPSDQSTIRREIGTFCVRKHHVDKLDCTDTAYWMADSLEAKGVDADLAIEWMSTCSDSCLNDKYVAPVLNETNPVGYQNKKKTERTKWIWEE